MSSRDTAKAGTEIELVFLKVKTGNVSGETVELVFGDDNYIPPEAITVVTHGFLTEFQGGAELVAFRQRSIASHGFIATSYGTANIINAARGIKTNGWLATTFGSVKVDLFTRYIKPTGFNGNAFSNNASIINFHKNANPIGFASQSFGRPTIYNLDQYLLAKGQVMSVYGISYVQGGVKNINGSGFNGAVIPQPKVINTRADQYANLQSPSRGIAPPPLPQPNVSPRILYASGILSATFGTAWIQRNPSPKGFTTDSYGASWVSHSPRYLTPSKVEAFQPSYPKVFDPTQRIYITGLNPISGGIFGDIALRNKNKFINLTGFDSQNFSSWSTVASNKRFINLNVFDASAFGKHDIKNVSLGIALAGFDSLQGLDVHIAYRIRTVKTRGVDLLSIGLPKLYQSPEIKNKGFNALSFGNTFISNYRRTLEPKSWNSFKLDDLTIWYHTRRLELEGTPHSEYGNAHIEDENRLLIAKGFAHSSYGLAWIAFNPRLIEPMSIVHPNIPIHLIGRNQSIIVNGFVATAFGNRIVPESQTVYLQGFANSYGNASIELLKRYIKPKGYMSTMQEGINRFGVSTLWNSIQHIKQVFDPNNGLVPPPWLGWTAIYLRNKSIGTKGIQHARIGLATIENKARLIHVKNFDAFLTGQALIADRIRYLRLQGLEPPYISGWSGIHNEARVLSATGHTQQLFGMPTVVNTRRYFNRIGNLQSLEFGLPMISERIRSIAFEHRYSIAPPIIRLPIVELKTRYIDEVGMRGKHEVFGNHELSIRWNKFTPRWTHKDYLGEPSVRNLTPEIKHRGRITAEFGDASVHLHLKFLPIDGYGAVLWGKTVIGFLDRSLQLNGRNHMAIGMHSVVKTGIPPYSLQPIDLNGFGIEPLTKAVSAPSIRANVIQPEGIFATKFGEIRAQSNGIILKSGIQEFSIGSHTVGLKNRTIQVPTMGDIAQIEQARPRLSPYTIYAVMEAPQQAITNHPGKSLHYVNSDSGNRPPGEIFGLTTITNQHRLIEVKGYNLVDHMPEPRIDLAKRYVNAVSFNAFRMGWHFCADGSPQYVDQYDSEALSLYGLPSIAIHDVGPQKIKPMSLSNTIIGSARIEFLNRFVGTRGFLSEQMGVKLSNDSPYKPQGLWVGEPMPTIANGFNAQLFGKHWVSLKVRDVSAKGFDAFVSEMNISNFKDRMKVILIKKPIIKESQEIKPQSFDTSSYGVPNIRLAVHYIRPDGNSDQYRKGAPQ